MGPCAATASKISVVSSESQSNVKKPKRSPETPWPSKTNIDDLPDVLLAEILSRLPHNKIVFQCKYVCSRWFSLISDEDFHCRFLWHQNRRNGNLAPSGRTLIFRDAKVKREFVILPELELPRFKTRNFSLRFLPCFEEPEYIEADDDEEPIVVGMHNDLVLCCATMSFQRDYYICNPYTKQFVQIPPAPRCHKDVRAGFICGPYYNEEVNRKQERIIQVDADFRFAIVRIVPRPLSDQYCSAFKFDVEIFSSETGRWTQSVVNSPREFCLDSIDRGGGIAYNGMLYWWSAHDGFIIGLNPYNYSSKNDNYPPADMFHSIAAPKVGWEGSAIYVPPHGRFSHLSVSRRGRLRFCHFMPDVPIPSISVWELEDDEGGDEWCSLTGNVFLSRMLYANISELQWERLLVNSIVVLAFDPSNDDILYLQLFDRIVICNIRERKFKETTLTNIPYNSVVRFGRAVFPYVLPRWPTPLPKLKILGKRKTP